MNKAAMAAYRVECVALSAAKKGLIIVKKIYGAVISKNRIRLAQITKATLRARAATLLQAAAAKVGAAGIGLLNISFRAYNAVVSLNRIRLSQITAAMVRARAATLLQAAATKVAAVGTRLLNFAMTANPIGALIRLVMLLAIGLVTLYKTCEPVRLVMDNLWGGIKAAASGVFNYLYTNFEFFAAAVEKLGRAWAKLKGWLGFGDEETPSDFTITTAEEKIAAAEAESAAATQPASSGMAFETVADTHTVAASGTALQPGAMEMPESLQADSLEVDDLEGLDLAMSGMDMPDVGSMDMAVPDIAGLQAQPAPQIQAPVTQEFSFNMNFTGMPDKEFAQRVVEAIKLQRSALQEPIAKIVADIMSRQKRLAYD